MTGSTVDPVVAVPPIWEPDPAQVERSRITAFMRTVERTHGVDLPDYEALWRWSVDSLEDFWQACWDFFDMRSDPAPGVVLASSDMPGAEWFPGVRLNYVAHVFRDRDPDAVAVVEVVESGASRSLTWAELERQVATAAAALRGLGVVPGDRVVGYVPNCAASVVAFLATAALGAVWSCCGPDYAAEAAAKRLAQLEPRVLICADGYHFGGRTYDRRDEAAELAGLLPTATDVLHVQHLGLDPMDVPGRRVMTWEGALAAAGTPQLRPEAVPFAHPLWVLYSSGTTGIPKGLVHGHGSVTLDFQKMAGLHLDMTGDDRLFWYTTTNWMMWNFNVNALLTGASIIVYDGSPAHPVPDQFWRVATEHAATVVGTSPGYLLATERAGGDVPRPAGLRMIGATGSPVPPGAYYWVREEFGPRVPLVSMSGGTDIVSALATGAPNKPIWPGEISCRALGAAVDTLGPTGAAVHGEVGELVVTRPMPTMPVTLWNDSTGEKYAGAYFDTFPGIWRHGDWATVTDRGTVVIHGRSDATLNRHGVRLGSADIYEVVEQLPGIREALVIGVDLADGGYWMPLFVVLDDGRTLDEAFRSEIAGAIRRETSPRHVPDEILQVPAIPHTRTGKKLEVPIKRILQGARPDQALSLDAVDDPTALDAFTGLTPPAGTRR
ncbi:acetoacetate--CoA ligase [Blastococcus sp. SYSU D00820]